MALKFFDETNSASKDLPWVNEFIDEHPEINEDFCSPVQSFVKSSKGWIVLCRDYKGFLFKDSSITAFLEDAISFWKEDSKNCSDLPGIFLTCESKPRLAFDDSFKGVSVLFEGKNKVLITWATGSKEVKKAKKPAINPFLPKKEST